MQLLAGYMTELPVGDPRDFYSYVGKIAHCPLAKRRPAGPSTTESLRPEGFHTPRRTPYVSAGASGSAASAACRSASENSGSSSWPAR